MKIRFFALFISLAVVISCGAVVFGAEQDMQPFDFWDYGTHVSEDGDYTIYSFDFDPFVYDPYCTWYCENSDDTFSGHGTLIDVPLLEDDTTYIEFEPFGHNGYYFPLDYVPAGTSVSGEIYADLNFSHDSYPPYTVGVYYVDEHGQFLDYEPIEGFSFDSAFVFSFMTKGVPGAAGFYFSFSVEIGTLYDGQSTMVLDEFILELRINNQAMSNLWDKTIAEKIDQIINRNPDPDVPGWNDGAEDVEDQEQEILDQLDPEQVQGDLVDMQLSIFDYVILYVSAFAAISAIFNYFMQFPLITLLLYLSLVLGLLASLLGIGLAVGRKVDRASRRSSGKKGRS